MLDRDSQLAVLLDELTAAAERGDNAHRAQLESQHPELAAEIRDLWGAVLVTKAVASYSATITHSPGTHSPSPGSSALIDEPRLPCELGDYTLTSEIGRGGMGIVYHARQKSLSRKVAVKLMLQGALASPDEQRRFRSEAEAVARLEHPGIIPIYEVGEHQGRLYFSMPLVGGETLAEKLRAGPLPNRDAARLVREIARAIHYAHQRGIIHRDLKPANVLVDDSGRVHVSDFGLAKRLRTDQTSAHTLTQTGAILGTPSYMAPEQASGGRGEVGPLSDVYSLGAILYALLTGRAPFQGPTPVDTVLMLLEQDPVAPRLLNRKIDRDLEMILLRSLQKPPELRYESAEALANDLDAYLRSEPIAARSGQFTQVLARVFRETHHAAILENWGLLWMWHALVLLVICLVTNAMYLARGQWPLMDFHLPYVVLWGGALAVWSPIFWKLRHRAGPVTAVERQIAHIWGGSIAAVMLLFLVEWELRLPVLSLSPVLGLISGMAFVVKAGILSGAFYLQAAALFGCSLLMAWMNRVGCDYGVTLYGLVSAGAFFLPGLKYFRQSRAGD